MSIAGISLVKETLMDNAAAYRMFRQVTSIPESKDGGG
jgi:hypothetical protein